LVLSNLELVCADLRGGKNMEEWEVPAKGTKRQAFDGN